jgi:hypothetical protein
MSEQEQVPPGSIPPKVSPFAKPEGASPVTPASPGAPRPITVRLKPVAPAAATPSEPAAQAPHEAVAPTPLSALPRMTARVPIPEILPDLPSVQLPPATVRLRPVNKPATEPVAVPPAAKPPQHPESFRTMDIASAAPAAAPLQPIHPPTPGSHPLPDGPKPPSTAQTQAAKSKTSRISLDSAIGVAPMSPMSADKTEPKTIRLKRPVDLAAPSPKVSTAPIRQTSRIPDSVLPTPEAAAAEASSVTQKKTLKIKRPGAREEGAAAASAAEGGESFPEGVALTPLSPIDFPVQEESGVFTKIALVAAVLALFAMGALVWCLLAHAMSPDHGRNSLASVPGTVLPWGNRIN